MCIWCTASVSEACRGLLGLGLVHSLLSLQGVASKLCHTLPDLVTHLIKEGAVSQEVPHHIWLYGKLRFLEPTHTPTPSQVWPPPLHHLRQQPTAEQAVEQAATAEQAAEQAAE